MSCIVLKIRFGIFNTIKNSGVWLHVYFTGQMGVVCLKNSRKLVKISVSGSLCLSQNSFQLEHGKNCAGVIQFSEPGSSQK